MNITQMLVAANSQIVTLVVLVVLMIGMFAISFIPQKKRQKRVQEMINNLTVGTTLKTIGGFIGVIKKVDGDTITLDISANNDDSMLVLIDRNAVYMVLDAVKTETGEVKLQEKPEITAMDDMEADNAKKEKKSKKHVEESSFETSGDSLEKKDNETLLKD